MNATTTKGIKIGITTQPNGEGSSTRCGIVRIDMKEDGIEFRAMTHQGELKRYETANAAAKFLRSRGFDPMGKKL